MEHPDYKLLLLDLDGTLLRKDEKITLRVSTTVKLASELILTSIATGREQHDVLRFARELGLTTPQISDNGAMVSDPLNGRCIWSSPLPIPTAFQILTAINEREAAFIATDNTTTVSNLQNTAGRNFNRISALDLNELDANKLVYDCKSMSDVELVKVFLPYNGKWAVDFTAVGINKAVAAKKLASLIGIKSDQIISAGDSYNDLPLLNISALRIVMGDAPEELKSVADFVAPSAEDDGLAVALEEFILPILKK